MAGLKAILKALPVVGPAGRAMRTAANHYDAWKRDEARHLRLALGNLEHATIVQIGSNDGATQDPVHQLLIEHPNWQGLMVEPVPFVFQRMKQNYGADPRFRFENVAVGEQAGKLRFYYLSETAPQSVTGLPVWYDQLGSFDRDRMAKDLAWHFSQTNDSETVASLVKHLLDQYQVEAMVETVTLSDLLKRNRIERIDLLHIDTEGYDWVILRQLDFSKYTPRVILFEVKHLSETIKTEARAFMADRYRLKDLGAEYLCQRV